MKKNEHYIPSALFDGDDRFGDFVSVLETMTVSAMTTMSNRPMWYTNRKRVIGAKGKGRRPEWIRRQTQNDGMSSRITVGGRGGYSCCNAIAA